MAHHINDLKLDHAEEIQSLRTQYEIEIQEAVKRTKHGLQKHTKETDDVESEENSSDPGKLCMKWSEVKWSEVKWNSLFASHTEEINYEINKGN